LGRGPALRRAVGVAIVLAGWLILLAG